MSVKLFGCIPIKATYWDFFIIVTLKLQINFYIDISVLVFLSKFLLYILVRAYVFLHMGFSFFNIYQTAILLTPTSCHCIFCWRYKDECVTAHALKELTLVAREITDQIITTNYHRYCGEPKRKMLRKHREELPTKIGGY